MIPLPQGLGLKHRRKPPATSRASVAKHTLSAAVGLPAGVLLADKLLSGLHRAPPQHQPGALSLHALGLLSASLQGWPSEEQPTYKLIKLRQVFLRGNRTAEAGAWLWVIRNRWGSDLTGPQMGTILFALFLVKLAAAAILLLAQGADRKRLVKATFFVFYFATTLYMLTWNLKKVRTGIFTFVTIVLQDLVRALPDAAMPIARTPLPRGTQEYDFGPLVT